MKMTCKVRIHPATAGKKMSHYCLSELFVMTKISMSIDRCVIAIELNVFVYVFLEKLPPRSASSLAN